MFLSFPPPTKMFQFRGLAHLSVCQAFCLTGCPIQKSPDQILFANPRSFSQLTTSFFASKSLGIPHTPLYTFLFSTTNIYIPLCRYLISSSMSMNFDRLLYLDRESNIEVSLLHALRDVAMFEEQSS